MKIDFSKEFKNLNNETLKSGETNVTLKSICTEALLNSSVEEKITGEEKAKRYNLALEIFASKQKIVEISIEDVAVIKKLVGDFYSPLVVGQAYKFLEG